jgi:hypothetical protein
MQFTQGASMNRPMIHAVLVLSLCPLLTAQPPKPAASPSINSQPTPAAQQTADTPQPSVIAERMQAIKNAQTICIKSDTVFLTVSTFDRALLMQKSWDQLGLNIVANEDCHGDLQIDIDRLPATHIHTYVLTDTRSNMVLAAGRVRAFDGVVASGPMAEQIVKILSAARLPAQAAVSDRGL